MERLVIEWNGFIARMRVLAARLTDVSLALPQGRTALPVLISVILLALTLTWQNAAHQRELHELRTEVVTLGKEKDALTAAGEQQKATIAQLQQNVGALVKERDALTGRNNELTSESEQQKATIAQLKPLVPPDPSHQSDFFTYLKDLFWKAVGIIGKWVLWEFLKDILRAWGIPIP